MTKQTKTLLGISITAFALSTTGAFWGMFLPIGAIFLGLFLISRLLQHETALYDAEHQARLALAQSRRVQSVRPPAATKSAVPVFRPSVAKAASAR